MKTKEITIGGVTYPVAFSMKTMLNFEEISGKPFFGESFDHLKERIALIMSAALTADDNTKLTIDDLMKGDEWDRVKELMAAYNTVMILLKKNITFGPSKMQRMVIYFVKATI